MNYIKYCKSNKIEINEVHKVKIVVINDTESCSDDYIVGSILLPNSRAMFYLIEGNYNEFTEEYYRKLDNDKDVQEYIAVLLAGLVERDFDYIFYFDTDDPNMYYPIRNALCSYLLMRYGVNCYDVTDVFNDNNIFLYQSVSPDHIVNIENIINSYKLYNKSGQLFVQY